MTKEYYDEFEYNKAIKMHEKNPYIVKERLEAYIGKYPNDYCARSYYIMILTRICAFDEAEIEYNKVMQDAYADEIFKANRARLSLFNNDMVQDKTKILAGTHKYKELYKHIWKNKYQFDPYDFQYIDGYCKVSLEKMKDVTSASYRLSQYLSYSDDKFKEHVKKHFSDFKADGVDSIFDIQFNFDKVFNEIKSTIDISQPHLFTGWFADEYYYKYDNCGKVDGVMTDYFKVVCFHDTDHFITMCPANIDKNMPHTDLNYLQETKIKRLSQIEKFNKKFNL